MKFPSKKELDKIRKESEKWVGTLALSPKATALERFRYQICQALLQYKQENELSNVKMAKLLDMPEADLSRVFRHRIEGISTDRLLGLLEKINPKHKIELKVS